MPPSTITTSGTQSPLVSSALSYPQNADPTTYLPYSSPQMIVTSGTWNHPKPGFPIKIKYRLIGGGGGGANGQGSAGGGGGGSGRISDLTFATVTTNLTVTIGAGGGQSVTGGTTTFNGLSATGGGGAAQNTAGGSPGGYGAAGGFGGGGGGGNGTDPGGDGGEGLDWVGGGAGVAGGSNGLTAAPGVSKRYQPGRNSFLNASTNVTQPRGAGGWPNGAEVTTQGGLGGSAFMLFPEFQGYGDGGQGYPLTRTAFGGAVLIWYERT